MPFEMIEVRRKFDLNLVICNKHILHENYLPQPFKVIEKHYEICTIEKSLQNFMIEWIVYQLIAKTKKKP